MPPLPLTNVASSSGVAAPSTSQVRVTRVSSGPSELNWTVVSIDSGQVGACGWRAMFPSLSQNCCLYTMQFGFSIFTYSNWPYIVTSLPFVIEYWFFPPGLTSDFRICIVNPVGGIHIERCLGLDHISNS